MVGYVILHSMKSKLLLTLLLSILTVAAFTTTFDTQAMDIHHDATERAFYAFAISKGLNAVISLIQGTELSAGLFVEASFSVGEVLDPLNDMIERFSWIMLAATISLGVQELLAEFGQSGPLQLLLASLLLFSIASLWYRPFQNRAIAVITTRFLIVLMLLRFGAIFFIGIESMLYASLLEQRYESATASLNETKTTLDPFSPQNGVSEAVEHVTKLKEHNRLSQLQEQLESAYYELMNLATLFALQSIMLPLLFFWLMMKGFGWAFTGRMDTERLILFLRKAPL